MCNIGSVVMSTPLEAWLVLRYSTAYQTKAS